MADAVQLEKSNSRWLVLNKVCNLSCWLIRKKFLNVRRVEIQLFACNMCFKRCCPVDQKQEGLLKNYMAILWLIEKINKKLLAQLLFNPYMNAPFCDIDMEAPNERHMQAHPRQPNYL